jgi:protein-S-isoprenylcysteine O-methyltransferase Ste14
MHSDILDRARWGCVSVAATEEEAYLVEFFGDAYRAFQRTVPTLIPFVK